MLCLFFLILSHFSCSRIPLDGSLPIFGFTAVEWKHFLPKDGSWKLLCTMNFELDANYNVPKVRNWFKLSVYCKVRFCWIKTDFSKIDAKKFSTSIYWKELLLLDGSTTKIWKASIYWYSATSDKVNSIQKDAIILKYPSKYSCYYIPQ